MTFVSAVGTRCRREKGCVAAATGTGFENTRRNRLYSQLLYYAGGFCFAVAAEGVKKS